MVVPINNVAASVIQMSHDETAACNREDTGHGAKSCLFSFAGDTRLTQ